MEPGSQTELSLPPASPANHSPLPDEEQERMMTATSGRRLSELLQRSGPLGLLAKMLLESSRWYSPLVSLRWQAEQMRSERHTTYIRSAASSSQSESVKTLRVSDIPSSRLLFRLVPSARHTDATEFGLLPTPTASGEENYSTRARRRGHENAMSYLQAHLQYQTGSTSQLSPLFVAEMMGFPLNWLVSPFQRGDGNL